MENNYDTDEEFDEETEIEPIKSLPPPDTTPDSPPPPPVPAPATVSSKKKKVEPFVWKEDMVYYLINKWQGEPVLYNIRTPNTKTKIKGALPSRGFGIRCPSWNFSHFHQRNKIEGKERGNFKT